jgi:hypothetical protein
MYIGSGGPASVKTFVIELVDSSQSCANSGTCSLPVVKFRQKRFGQAEPEVCWHHPFDNKGSIVVEGIGVSSSRYLMFLLAIEVRL